MVYNLFISLQVYASNIYTIQGVYKVVKIQMDQAIYLHLGAEYKDVKF